MIIEETGRESGVATGFIVKNGVKVFAYRDYGCPEPELELECAQPVGCEVKFGIVFAYVPPQAVG
ncbi:hypothetical protein ABZ943_38550, partial [Streptomyces rubiginosohelvolus]